MITENPAQGYALNKASVSHIVNIVYQVMSNWRWWDAAALENGHYYVSLENFIAS